MADKVCRRCGDPKRPVYALGLCLRCYQRVWRAKNPDYYRESYRNGQWQEVNGMAKEKLAAKVRARMTPKENRVGDPHKVGRLDRIGGQPLSEAWCTEMVGSGHSVTTLAQMAGITNEEMFNLRRRSACRR